MTKTELRHRMRNTLSQWLASVISSLPSAFERHLSAYLADKRGDWGAFFPTHHEPPISGSLQSVSHLRWAFPRVRGEDMDFYLNSPAVQYAPNSWGILEPLPETATPVKATDLQGILLPGLAFDMEGRRLGRGKAFYDRSLKHFRGFKVGVAFSCQVMSEPLPEEPHDVKVDALVTEQGVFERPRDGQPAGRLERIM